MHVASTVTCMSSKHSCTLHVPSMYVAVMLHACKVPVTCMLHASHFELGVYKRSWVSEGRICNLCFTRFKCSGTHTLKDFYN